MVAIGFHLPETRGKPGNPDLDWYGTREQTSKQASTAAPKEAAESMG